MSNLSLLLLILLILLPALTAASQWNMLTEIQLPLSTTNSTTLPPDAMALLSFRERADVNKKLNYSSYEHHCKWQGVKCTKGGRVIQYDVQDLQLQGYFARDTLAHLDQLEILSLRNNSLFGPIPDLSPLINLKSLFLDQNNFSGSFPISVLFLHRLVALSLHHNNLTGSLPMNLTLLDRLILLHLESNHFSGLLPPINQTYLKMFDVSANNFTGPIPLTPTLSRFTRASFLENPGLCGEIVRRQCDDHDDGDDGDDDDHDDDHDEHHDHHQSSVGFIVTMVILVVAFAAVVVIVVIKRKPVATGFGVLKQQVEMVKRW